MKRISALLGGAVFSVAILAACGGGGGNSGPGAPVVPGATPTPAGDAPQSFSATDAAAIPTPAPGAATVPVPLPSDPSGASATAILPASASVPTDATISATYSNSADPSAPPLSAMRATASRSVREDQKNGVIAYLKLQFSADVSVPQAPGFTFVVPGTLPTTNVSYWLAFFDPLRAAAGWQKGFEGPATVAPAQTANGKTGTKLTFASNGQPLSFVAGQAYYFAVLAVPSSTATPTPVPSSVPTNPPHDGKPAAVLASPANIQFPALTSSPVPLTFTQQGFAGPFTLHGDCTGVVNTNGASPTWTITPVGQGRCVIIGIGDRGASAVVHVGVVTPFETPHPTSSPTTSPTNAPSRSPEPTHPPTTAPSSEPSHSPEPTEHPTTSPSPKPTASPTPTPSHSPEPTSAPSTTPRPTATPTPTSSPTV